MSDLAALIEENARLRDELASPRRRERVLPWMERGVRWRADINGFEMRCDSCATRMDAAGMYWPLDLDHWSPSYGLSRCRACWASYRRAHKRKQRASNEFRLREHERAAAYRRECQDAIRIKNAEYRKRRADR